MTYSKLHVSRFVRFHSFTSMDSIIAANHFDKSMAFVDVDNASLNDTKFAKQRTEMRFR